MLKREHEELHEQYRKAYATNQPFERQGVINIGREKNNPCTITGVTSKYLDVRTKTCSHRIIPYTRVHLVDEQGQPIVKQATDMFGRTINVGAVLLYTRTHGVADTAMQVGVVTKVFQAGGIKLDRKIRNGRRNSGTDVIHFLDRTVLLGIEEQTVMMWLMTDFDLYRFGEI